MTMNYKSCNDSLRRVSTCIHRSNGMKYIEHDFFPVCSVFQTIFRDAFCLFFLKNVDTILTGCKKVYAIAELLLKN